MFAKQGHPGFAVFDFDGTLCDNSHRAHLIQGPNPDYDAWREACRNDPPKIPVLTMMEGLIRADWRVEIWTAREIGTKDDLTKWGRATQAWLAKHMRPALPIPEIRMRPVGDHSAAVKVKSSFLVALGVPDFAVEDDPSVVALYRDWGVEVMQVQPPAQFARPWASQAQEWASSSGLPDQPSPQRHFPSFR